MTITQDIMRILRNRGEPLTAALIYEELARDAPSVKEGTVRRALHRLVQRKVVEELRVNKDIEDRPEWGQASRVYQPMAARSVRVPVMAGEIELDQAEIEAYFRELPIRVPKGILDDLEAKLLEAIRERNIARIERDHAKAEAAHYRRLAEEAVSRKEVAHPEGNTSARLRQFLATVK